MATLSCRTMTPIRTGLAMAAATLLAACAPTLPANAAPAESPAQVQVKVLAINDFHGHLQPPPGGFRQPDPKAPGQTVAVPAGGAEYMASALRELRARSPHHVFVAAGDLVGASPLLSALFHDEPAIESLSLMGLEFAAVGNHEFDHGRAELLRLQNGGCHPGTGCKGPAPFAGARFQYLAASTVDAATGQTLFPPYAVKRFDGIAVAFIGLTLKGTPHIVVPSGVAGLQFRDEAETVNALVPELRRQGIEAIVLLIHEGGETGAGPDECPGVSGPIVGIVERLDPAVDAVVSGHTHQAYNCRIGGRLVTSAHRFGTLLTEIDLTLDRRSRDVVSASAHNLVIRHDRFTRDGAQTALIASYAERAAPLARRVVGTLSRPATAERNAAGESRLGRLVADAQLAATAAPGQGGAQIALTNPGGLRSPLLPGPGGEVRYEAVFGAQPFSNQLVTMTLSGAQLKQVLEQQLNDPQDPRLLPVSRGFTYTWDARRPRGERVLADSLMLNGRPIAPGERLRITVNSYLAEGGDGFRLFTQGTERLVGMLDVDALAAHIGRGAEPDDTERVRRLP